MPFLFASSLATNISHVRGKIDFLVVNRMCRQSYILYYLKYFLTGDFKWPFFRTT